MTSISHPTLGFLRSFYSPHEGFPEFPTWTDDKSSKQWLPRKAKLEGFPHLLPATIDDGVHWEDAKAWEDALEMETVKRPSNIQGFDEVSMLDTLLSSILPSKVASDNLQCLIPLEEYLLRSGIKLRSSFLNYWRNSNDRHKREKTILDVKYTKVIRKFALRLGSLSRYCAYSKR
ncbi:hypothetical protein QC761_0097810 [Podospora bellae-mahoneyi]|uniref:Uncharacterized protein n=1 Tax=Podospora bellae-mahoneyi TaxID=2093777 RepID=A0ABR0FAJ5_9PEZI|nr:hypothetical protein QC761_0097810 [Podospora bellae-mahoneyi]